MFSGGCVKIPSRGGIIMLQLNTVGLQKVMQDFHTITKIRIVIFDAEFQEVMAFPPKRENFCHLLRSTPKGDAICFRSDKQGCLQCAKCKELVIYRCHAGLTEVVVPIIEKGDILAYVMFGQIISRENSERTKKRLKSDYPEFAHEVDNIPIKSQQELNAAATVLQAITTYMMTNHWVAPSKSSFIREIDRYIDEHLSQHIKADDLCAVFRVGRTKLYEISEDYLGCGLAEYIRNQRIARAQQMLLQTDTSITEIAFLTGFSDYNHFSRVFKKIVGISAREYRKKQSRHP